MDLKNPVLKGETVMTYNKMQTDLFRYLLNAVDSPALMEVGIIYLLESSTRQKKINLNEDGRHFFPALATLQEN